MKNIIKMIIMLGMAILFLTSCGSPHYQTRYAYTAPEKEAGKTCTFQCRSGKLQCEQIVTLTAMNRCKNNQGCINNNTRIGNKKCEKNYRDCYTMCGGKVKVEKVCVANCQDTSDKTKILEQ